MFEEKNYIDFSSALARLGGNEGLYKRLLTIFLGDVKIDSLYDAIEKNEYKEIATIAHTIKGVAANLSLINLQNIAASIDNDAKANLDCNKYIPDLKKYYDKTVEEINNYIGS